jgi:hypothetical protein
VRSRSISFWNRSLRTGSATTSTLAPSICERRRSSCSKRQKAPTGKILAEVDRDVYVGIRPRFVPRR